MCDRRWCRRCSTICCALLSSSSHARTSCVFLRRADESTRGATVDGFGVRDERGVELAVVASPVVPAADCCGGRAPNLRNGTRGTLVASCSATAGAAVVAPRGVLVCCGVIVPSRCSASAPNATPGVVVSEGDSGRLTVDDRFTRVRPVLSGSTRAVVTYDRTD